MRKTPKKTLKHAAPNKDGSHDYLAAHMGSMGSGFMAGGPALEPRPAMKPGDRRTGNFSQKGRKLS